MKLSEIRIDVNDELLESIRDKSAIEVSKFVRELNANTNNCSIYVRDVYDSSDVEELIYISKLLLEIAKSHFSNDHQTLRLLYQVLEYLNN